MKKTLNFETVDEEVEFWKSHSSAEYWDDMEKVEFEIDLHRNLLHPKLIVIADQPVQCPRCHHDLEETVIQYVTLHNGHLLIIRDVPALRCLVNGHEYMLEKTLDQVRATKWHQIICTKRYHWLQKSMIVSLKLEY